MFTTLPNKLMPFRPLFFLVPSITSLIFSAESIPEASPWDPGAGWCCVTLHAELVTDDESGTDLREQPVKLAIVSSIFFLISSRERPVCDTMVRITSSNEMSWLTRGDLLWLADVFYPIGV